MVLTGYRFSKAIISFVVGIGLLIASAAPAQLQQINGTNGSFTVPADCTGAGKALTISSSVWGCNTISASGSSGYTLNVQALTSSPADGATVYFGMLPKAPITTAGVSKVYIRTAGTITIANVYSYSGTAGTSEAWSLYVRLNNTTDTLIATVSAATSERVFVNTGLNIAVVAGNFVEIKSVQPTWATNPLTTIYGGYLYVQQ